MTSTETGKSLREGSAQKRAAILGAGRELFLADGFERTSVDAIASRAGVSKRTVYDYYGDKRTLLLAVVEQAVEALVAAIQRSMDAHLTDVESTDLEAALVAFARNLTESALGSADYSALTRLVQLEAVNLPELRDRWGAEPEDDLAERFRRFGEQGLLEVPKPRVAANHFVALTLSPGASAVGRPLSIDDERTQQIIVEGVAAFLRAYRPRGAELRKSAGARSPDPQ